MVLDNKRASGERVLGPLADKLAPLGADKLTWISVSLAFAAGAMFATSAFASGLFLILGALLVFASAVFDALDGLVARRTKTASPAGDFLDHALDRYADLFIIGGLAASPFGNFRWGLLALSGVFLTSYIATQASAVGLKRDYRGVLGRADRLVLLTLVPILQGALVLANVNYTFHFAAPWRPGSSPLETVTPVIALLMMFAILGHLTAVQRFARARRALLERQRAPDAAPEQGAPPPG